MQRRSFVKSVSAAAALSVLPFSAARLPGKFESVIKPPRLNQGDTLGLISPGSFINEAELKTSVENLEKLGYKVYYTKNILAKEGYLGGTDRQRADDIHEMFSNKKVKGIVCTRGGYGCARILPLLDYDLIRENPKVLTGYSDITSLLYGIFSQTGMVCFHGPVGISTYNDYSITNFNDVVVYPHEQLTFFSKQEDKEGEAYKIKTIVSGKGRGRLVGGNLSLVVSMLGTPYDIDTEDKIIFLEETGEEPYRVDRLLTQMLQAGKFENAAGIALGVFTKSDPKVVDTGITNSFTLTEVLFDRLGKLKIPVVYGLSFGHVVNKITLPFGIEAELDSLEQTITLLEPAVS